LDFNWAGKSVFVSGGAGVIGTALVNQLLQAGARVFVGDLKPLPSAWIQQVKSGVLNYRQGDLLSMQSEEIAQIAPEIYFHLAATFERSEETYAFWGENFHHNVHLSHHLMQLLKELPKLQKVVFASSYLVYNPDQYLSTGQPKPIVPLHEECAAAPRNLCGAAKFYHERELAFLKLFKPHLQLVSARIFRSYGKDSRDIVSRWIRAALLGEVLQVFRPEGRFDFVHAEDVAFALKKLAETDFSGVVNVGSGRARAIQELVELLWAYFPGLQTEVQESSIPLESSQADMRKFYALTQWNGFRPLEQTVPEIIAYNKDK
jgi:carbamoyl-phosphate synthase large subunit